jgi:hypothetical protein
MTTRTVTQANRPDVGAPARAPGVQARWPGRTSPGKPQTVVGGEVEAVLASVPVAVVDVRHVRVIVDQGRVPVRVRVGFRGQF